MEFPRVCDNSRGNLYQLDAYDDDEDNDGDVQPLPSPSSPLYDAFALGALSSSTRAGGDIDSDADVGNGNGEGDASLPSQPPPPPPPPPPPSLQALQALQHVDSDLDEASFDEQQQQQQRRPPPIFKVKDLVSYEGREGYASSRGFYSGVGGATLRAHEEAGGDLGSGGGYGDRRGYLDHGVDFLNLSFLRENLCGELTRRY